MSQLAIPTTTLRPRHYLTLATVSIVVIGCLAVLSAADGASAGSAFGYFAKAAIFGALGVALMVYLGRGGRSGHGGLAMAHKFTFVLLMIGFAGVILVMLPTPITPTINGAKRWIVLPGFTIQPSEILKPALVLYIAAFLAEQPWRARSLKQLQPVLLIAGAALAIVANEDLGSALVLGAVLMTLLFIANVPGRMLGVLMGVAALGATALTIMAPERVSRLAVFLEPFKDRFGEGFQITNGLLAIGSGGVFGRGIGESFQKHVIPEPQTDFIMPVIMEEVGLLGATVIIALYVALVLIGLRIALRTQDPYERLVAVGLTAIIFWQAALNIWVVLGIAPLTGVPLPLISAGSTSQLIILAIVGLLIDIDRRSETPTVPLVVPIPEPRPVRREPVIDGAPDPQPGELRVVDQRHPTPTVRRVAGSGKAAGAPARSSSANASQSPASARAAQPPQAASAARPAPQHHDAGQEGAASSKLARFRKRHKTTADAKPAGPTGPTVREKVGGVELLSDGTVRLANGRIGRPKKPMALPDGRVLMPDGRLVSRERAALSMDRAQQQ